MARTRRSALAAAGILIAGAAAAAAFHLPPSCTAGDGTLPDRSCTPGQVDTSITVREVCNGDAAGRPRRVSDAMKDQVIRAYGYDPASFRGEVDHLVSRQLGGTDTVSNLWPEPGPVPNPKDAVENRLRREVCAGTLSLTDAQTAIARDWKHAR